MEILSERQDSIGAASIDGDDTVCKVSAVGLGMRSHVGVAAKIFRTLAEEGINIQMISTSEIKVSVLIDEKYMELATRVLHKAFDWADVSRFKTDNGTAFIGQCRFVCRPNVRTAYFDFGTKIKYPKKLTIYDKLK
ncbi:aspartate kinase [Neisseria gonorrhoeae]|uniref:aspartate kinase n=1 Tax=Neisseria gonorrhoeae TaxID=485 RepID=A0A378VXV8_NEIGO|nr:aspartate kinase [Neisseria gonorrhoeae]